MAKLAARARAGAVSSETAATAIAAALTAGKAPAKILVGRDARILAALKGWLPTSWLEAILRREIGITESPTVLPQLATV